MRSKSFSFPALAGVLWILVATSAASAQAWREGVTDDHLLGGEWRGRAGGNVELNISLFRDGTYVRRLVVVTEYGWTAEPRALNIAEASRQGQTVTYGRPMSMRMNLTDSTLVTSFRGDSITLHRMPTDTYRPSLLGRWQGETAAGEEVIDEFFEDGRLLVSVTVSRDTGRYSASKGSIEWDQQIPKARKYREKYGADENTLKLFVDVGSRPIVLTRAPDQEGAN